MNRKNTVSYLFKTFRLDVAERRLLENDTPISLTPKAFDVLVYLVEHSGRLVEKEDLIRTVWPDSFVDESNVARIIHTLRKALKEDENGNKFIETVATKGYRFVAPVDSLNGERADVSKLDERSSTAGTDQNMPGGEVHSPIRDRRNLILGIVLMVAIVATGGWFVNRSLTGKTASKKLTPQTSNGEAYQNYQQGRVLIERDHKGDMAKALAHLERAISLDPNFADAYAGKADAQIHIFWGSKTQTHDEISQVRTAIAKALELDESRSYAHTLQCRLKATYDWDFRGAEKECLRAIELDPGSHEAHREMAFFRNSFGREDEALREMDTAVALSPTSFNKRSRGLILYYSRRYDEAIEQLKQVKETDEEFSEVRKWLLSCYEQKKDYDRALEARIGQLEDGGAPPEEIEATKAAFSKDGWPGVLRRIVEPTPPVGIVGAMAYAQLGDADRAFEALDKLFDRRAIMLVQAAREPRFDPIKNDPRFDDLLKRIGLK